ncbi:retrovirus-related Pol polyprotein from transposon 17.6 [Trichonephila clavipes]|nr:retrovirus-related Pol polyprotein from transposon 17.6 [Trichonephila clavipes]
MNFDIIIGCNVIKQANFTITPDSVMFSKPQIEVSDASPQPFVFAITDDIPKFDIGSEIPKQTRNDVEALLVLYGPNKIKTTDIELSITVTDDKPIYHSPRRLPFTERDIVDKQIDEWTQNGLTGYFRKFIPAYFVIAKPLSDILCKDTPFNFDVKQKAFFDELKSLLSQKPVLGIYRQNCETEIHTDASIDGLAAVLLKRSLDDNSLHLIYYMSRKTSETERKYTSYELEVLAIIEALRKFKVYILGMPFKIITDCNAFTKTMSKKDLNTRITRWALNLQDYDYTILHCSGSQMAHVDALSRIQLVLAIHQNDHQARRRFVEWAQNEIAIVPDFHKRNLFSDEAHFWLNGYVYKENCRIWRVANPQVYVETPLNPEKLTAWCALWAGGIIGPYFFKNDEGHNVTVNGDRYRAMITNFFIPELNNHDVQELGFQQNGGTCHTARATIDLLKDTFGDRLISRFGPVNWPPRSCDLTPLDYFLWGYVKSLVYADKPQTLDHLEDNIRRVIADIRPQMLKKVIENWTSRLDYIRASRGSHMPEIIFKITKGLRVTQEESPPKCNTTITSMWTWRELLDCRRRHALT